MIYLHPHNLALLSLSRVAFLPTFCSAGHRSESPAAKLLSSKRDASLSAEHAGVGRGSEEDQRRAEISAHFIGTEMCVASASGPCDPFCVQWLRALPHKGPAGHFCSPCTEQWCPSLTTPTPSLPSAPSLSEARLLSPVFICNLCNRCLRHAWPRSGNLHSACFPQR